jgi:hypothetical protein
MVGEAHPTARRSSSTLAGFAPPFSHGIVAFSGWPLNALQGDNNHEKVNEPAAKFGESGKTLGKKSLPKIPVFLGENEHSRSEPMRKPRKKPR